MSSLELLTGQSKEDLQFKGRWLDMNEPQVIFCQGKRKCIDIDDFIYTPNGITQVKDIYEGMPILGGYIKSPYFFEDEVYEVTINKMKFRANSEHPLWIAKVPPYRQKFKDGRWFTVKDIYDYYSVKKAKKSGWYALAYKSQEFNFKTISVGKTLAKLLGYLMSDGYFSQSQSIKFTNVNQTILEEVTSLALSLSEQYQFTIKEYPKGNGKDLLLTGRNAGQYSNQLKNQFRELGIINKTTFGKLQLLQDDEIIEFLKGYFNGDGNLDLRKPPEIQFFIGIHERQAYEFQFMLWRLGINSTVYSQEPNKNYKQTFWRIRVKQRESVKKLLTILDDTKYPEKFSESRKNIEKIKTTCSPNITKDFIYYPITKIKKIGKRTVAGWNTQPSNEIISYQGLKTHNSGKGVAIDEMIMEMYEAGFTILHLWAARNNENWYYALVKNCKKFWDKWREEHNEELKNKTIKEPLHCHCTKAIPISVIIPIEIYQKINLNEVDRFNGRTWKNYEEFKDAYDKGIVDDYIPNEPWIDFTSIKKPKKLWGKELIRLKPIHIPKGKNEAVFWNEFVEMMLEAREERRIVIMNPMDFLGDDKFVTAEYILRNIRKYTFKYCLPLDPNDVGKKTRDEMSNHEKKQT